MARNGKCSHSSPQVLWFSHCLLGVYSNDGKNTVGDVIADGLLKEVLHYKFPAFTAILCDVLSVIDS